MKIDEQFIASNKALTLPRDKLLAYEHDFQNYNSFSSSDSITKRRRFASSLPVLEELKDVI